MNRESVESRMKCEVARYIYEKRLCPSILLLVSLRRRPPAGNGEWECGMSWNERSWS
jgi:hypothetical protein